jgi:hypothetical protein
MYLKTVKELDTLVKEYRKYSDKRNNKVTPYPSDKFLNRMTNIKTNTPMKMAANACMNINNTI